MFEQNPHPIYTSLLENEYKILESKNTTNSKWYEILCGNRKVMMGIEKNVSHIYDYFGFKTIHYGILPKFDIENLEEELKPKVVLDKLKCILIKSLNTKNIEFMNLVLFEITNLYPNIEKISFLEMNEYSHDVMIFSDQNNQFYELTSKDISKFINQFNFIIDLKITSYINIKKTSNHETLKSIENALLLKKSLNLDFDIQKIV